MSRAAELARPMTFEDFLAFVEERPDGERWELVNGVPAMSASPADFHRIIVANLITFLLSYKNAHGLTWIPLPGHTVPAPPSMRSATIPDIVVKPDDLTGRPFSPDPIAVIEVLSRSNTKADRQWRLNAYAATTSIEHYLMVEQARVHVVLYDRARGWSRTGTRDIAGAIAMPALGVTLPLATIYQWTSFDPKLELRRSR